jgi:hypothetical protein
MQQFLKPATGAARAWVIAPELLGELLRAMHDALAALHARFGWIAFAAFTDDLETEARASS